MEFELVTPEKSPSMYNPNQVPIVLFPGVLNNPNELTFLVKELIKQYPDRPIYVYKDSEIEDAPLTLEEKVDYLAKKLQIFFPEPHRHHFTPVILIGYSYGCVYAGLIGQLLKDALVYLIDGLSPIASHAFFTSVQKAASAVSNLIDIVNYAGQLSGFSCKLSLDEREIQHLATLSFKARIDAISKQMINRQQSSIDEYNLQMFQCHLEKMKTNLQHLIDFEGPHPSPTLTIKTLFTDITQAKYQSIVSDGFGGWESYAANIENDTVLAHATHAELLNMGNARLVAASINTFINKHIEKKILANRVLRIAQQIEYLVKQDKNSFSLDLDLTSLQTTLSSLAAEMSPSNSPPSEHEDSIASRNLMNINIPTSEPYTPKKKKERPLSYSDSHYSFLRKNLSQKKIENIDRVEPKKLNMS